jgi:hypothetical protein
MKAALLQILAGAGCFVVFDIYRVVYPYVLAIPEWYWREPVKCIVSVGCMIVIVALADYARGRDVLA